MEEQIKPLKWWPKKDFPVRSNTQVTTLVDGKAIFFEMCISFLLAKRYIYLAHWAMVADFLLVRGKDWKAGADSSDEQMKLEERLAKRGLQEKDIMFWKTNPLTVENVLAYKMNQGIEVKVLLWGTAKVPFVTYYNPDETYRRLHNKGIPCIIDDSSNGFFHYRIQSIHQKTSVIDGQVAFVGGIDPLITNNDFDRWDEPSHGIISPLRAKREHTYSHPWHDTQVLIKGIAVRDVEQNFRKRWNDVVVRKGGNDQMIPEHPMPDPVESSSLVQIVRTMPKNTYQFNKKDIRGIARSYQRGIKNAKQFIYIENQYLWFRSYIGLDFPFFGTSSIEMKRNIRYLARALRRGVDVVLILPDEPNVGRKYTDAGVERLLQLYNRKKKRKTIGKLYIFCLVTDANLEDKQIYRPIYVHTKLLITDDMFTTLGSANLNSRGLRNDVEMNVSVLDQTFAKNLRLQLWAEHLGIFSDDELDVLRLFIQGECMNEEEEKWGHQLYDELEQTFMDTKQGLERLHDVADKNLKRFKDGLPLIGHLLPYFTEDQAFKQGLRPWMHNHGWTVKN